VRRHHDRWTAARRGARSQIAEPLLDPGLDRLGVEIADDDHRHQVRPVPVVIVPLEGLGRDRLDGVLAADRKALGIRRAGQRCGDDGVE
jgi:hypothetical protein